VLYNFFLIQSSSHSQPLFKKWRDIFLGVSEGRPSKQNYGRPKKPLHTVYFLCEFLKYFHSQKHTGQQSFSNCGFQTSAFSEFLNFANGGICLKISTAFNLFTHWKIRWLPRQEILMCWGHGCKRPPRKSRAWALSASVLDRVLELCWGLRCSANRRSAKDPEVYPNVPSRGMSQMLKRCWRDYK
jgi:hypothetical protein